MTSDGDALRLDGMEEAVGFLTAGDDFLLTAHVNADADAIGSCLALRRLLQGAGKRAEVLLEDNAASYAFMHDASEVGLVADGVPAGIGRVVVLDCPVLDRTGKVGQVLDAALPLLNMDHHPGNALFGGANLVSTGVSSTCELVYHLARAWEAPIDLPTAELLYTGILFDTGGFRFSLATPTTFEVAGDLVRRGVRLQWIADRLFGDKALGDLKVLGRALDSLQLHLDGRVAVLHLAPEDLRQGQPEEVVNYGLMLRGVEVAVLLKESAVGRFRVSLRSREPVDVGQVAAGFGGGGHRLAAGCSLEGSVATVQARLLDAAATALP